VGIWALESRIFGGKAVKHRFVRETSSSIGIKTLLEEIAKASDRVAFVFARALKCACEGNLRQ
jgi:hypothetical protein